MGYKFKVGATVKISNGGDSYGFVTHRGYAGFGGPEEYNVRYKSNGVVSSGWFRVKDVKVTRKKIGFAVGLTEDYTVCCFDGEDFVRVGCQKIPIKVVETLFNKLKKQKK